jgi:hypothetical protein
MRKTTASQSPKHRNTVSQKPSGLIGQGKHAQQSATVESALANRFHRTTCVSAAGPC